MQQNTGRSAMFAVVGGYLIYMAYELLKSLLDHEATSMPPALQIIVIILFTLIGIALLIFAWKIWKDARADHDEHPVELTEQAEEEEEEEEKE